MLRAAEEVTDAGQTNALIATRNSRTKAKDEFLDASCHGADALWICDATWS